jgi:small-conductance mechanosensitive channel
MSPYFALVGKQRKYTFLGKVILLILILMGLAYGYLGVFVPAELWRILAIFLFVSSVANLVRFFTVTAYRKRSLLPVGERDNFVLGIDSLAALVVFIITVASVFAVFEIAFQTFLTSISLVAVALVLIFRDYISNYLDSLRLMFTTDYRIGDYIKVSEFTKGVITDVHFRATKLKTDEGDVLFIPNTKLMTSEVVNYSKTKFKRIIVPFSLPTESLLSIETFEQKLKDVLLEQFPDRVKATKMFLRIENIKQWQTECKFEISVDHYNFSIEEQITKAVYLSVLQSQKNMKTPQIIITT